MSTNELINIWKKEVNNQIPAYYKNELEKTILSKDKKMFRSIHSISTLVILIIGIVFFSTLLFLLPANKWVFLYLIALMLLFLYGIFLWIRSYIQINKNTRNKTLKEWLRFRIDEIEKKLPHDKKLPGKKFYISYSISFLLITIVCMIFIPDIYLTVLLVGIVTLLQTYFGNKKLKTQLEQFKRLYKLLEQEESGIDTNR